MKLKNVDELSETDIYHILGEPHLVHIPRPPDHPMSHYVPHYLVNPGTSNGFIHCGYGTYDFALLKAETTHSVTEPLEGQYPFDPYPPELMFDDKTTSTSDIWMFANLLWQARTGSLPFGEGRGMVPNMELLLGPLPEDYHAVWEEQLALYYFEDDATSTPRSQYGSNNSGEETQGASESAESPRRWFQQSNENAKPEDPALGHQNIMEMGTQGTSWIEEAMKKDDRVVGDYEIWDGNTGKFARLSDLFDDTVLSQYYVGKYRGGDFEDRPPNSPLHIPDDGRHFFRGDLTYRVSRYSTPLERDLATDWPGCHTESSPFEPRCLSPMYDRGPLLGGPQEWGGKVWRIPNKEIPILADLLSKMWKYNPAERTSTYELLKHEWFADRHIPDRAIQAIAKNDDYVMTYQWSLPHDPSVLRESQDRTQMSHCQCGRRTPLHILVAPPRTEQKSGNAENSNSIEGDNAHVEECSRKTERDGGDSAKDDDKNAGVTGTNKRKEAQDEPDGPRGEWVRRLLREPKGSWSRVGADIDEDLDPDIWAFAAVVRLASCLFV